MGFNAGVDLDNDVEVDALLRKANTMLRAYRSQPWYHVAVGGFTRLLIQRRRASLPSTSPATAGPAVALADTGLLAGHKVAATVEPDLDSASAAAFWRFKKSRAEGQFLAALHHLQFNRKMLADAFTCSIGPAVAEGSQSGRVHFVDPSIGQQEC